MYKYKSLKHTDEINELLLQTTDVNALATGVALIFQLFVQVGSPQQSTVSLFCIKVADQPGGSVLNRL